MSEDFKFFGFIVVVLTGLLYYQSTRIIDLQRQNKTLQEEYNRLEYKAQTLQFMYEQTDMCK